MTKKHFIELAFTDEQLEFLANFCESQNGQFLRDRWLGYIREENGPNGGRK